MFSTLSSWLPPETQLANDHDSVIGGDNDFEGLFNDDDDDDDDAYDYDSVNSDNMYDIAIGTGGVTSSSSCSTNNIMFDMTTRKDHNDMFQVVDAACDDEEEDGTATNNSVPTTAVSTPSSSSSNLVQQLQDEETLHQPPLAAPTSQAPPPPATVDEANKLLSDTMNSLTLQERQDVYEDIHGVRFASTSTYNSSSSAVTASATSSLKMKKEPILDQSSFEGTGRDHDPEQNIQQLLVEMDLELVSQAQESGQRQQSLNDTSSSSSSSSSWWWNSNNNNSQKKNNTTRQEEDERHHLTNVDNSTSLSAYHIALNQNPNYIRGIRIWFLRCELYDVKKAATRMIGYLEFKRNVFGEELLGTEIQMKQHLTKDDIEYLNVGHIQILPKCDSSGRLIQFRHIVGSTTTTTSTSSSTTTTKDYDSFSELTKIRVAFYLGTVIAKRINMDGSYLKGIVNIGYLCGVSSSDMMRQRLGNSLHSPEGRKYLHLKTKLNSLQPFRTSSIHICCNDDPLMRLLFATIQIMLTRTSSSGGGSSNTNNNPNNNGGATSTVVRTRSHYGTHIEVMYQLMTFGIHPNILPIVQQQCTIGNNNYGGAAAAIVNNHHHLLFLQQIRQQEEEEESSSSTDGQTGAKPFACGSMYTTSPHVQDIHEDNKRHKEEEDGRRQQSPTKAITPSASPMLQSVQQDTPQKEQQHFEENSNNSFLLQPRPNDVLLRRGTNARHHPGNIKFHTLVEKYTKEYEAESRFGKTILAATITQLIQKNGGRFLTCTSTNPKESPITWELATDMYARDRVAHAFRNKRRKAIISTTASASTTSSKPKMLSQQQKQQQQQQPKKKNTQPMPITTMSVSNNANTNDSNSIMSVGYCNNANDGGRGNNGCCFTDCSNGSKRQKVTF